MYLYLSVIIILGLTTHLYYNSKYILQICPYDNEYLIDYYSNYQNKYYGDSGVDLIIPYNITLKSSQYTTIYYHVNPVMITNYHTVSYFIFPRSSMSTYPLIYVNSISIIDAGFRGNLSTYVYNPTNTSISLKKGTKLVQICSQDLSEINVVVNCNESNLLLELMTNWLEYISSSIFNKVLKQHRNLNGLGSSS